MKRTTTTAAAIGLSIATALSLSACANPLDSLMENVVRGGVENLVENELGENVDINVPGENGASLPESWPEDVPTPDGEILFSVATGENWSATIEVPDQAIIDRTFLDLEDSGYELVAESDFGAIVTRTYESDTRSVTIGVVTDEDTGTLTVQYGILDKTAQ